ncbi:aspartate-semialdehyde dehydrogenase [Fructobacillus pseudoficulneus]|uniref:Aspartate-semialdehyde dehydrogenase n=1 Tax=Fructobacillus pseudoficulneus TaxID=220714 RepID=A0A3F3GR33_9LACO|nr:aspartate-semialdehyde dehydrogenase [Fructobacillus pseudoficulneus]GAP02211.1 aspartate-semialdehyde dehydrogenase [Fructobacillus pseudoficulneus]SEH36077.1 aspartate-semialdehyde dehydrogenase [Fructobacillus pseudoficulneus]
MVAKNSYNVAVLGATGAVGRRILEQLAQSTIPFDSVKALASAHSAGQKVPFQDGELVVEEANEHSFDDVDIVLASAGGSTSKALAPAAVKAGAVVVDNSSYWRMNDQVPLVVPEVNADALKDHQGIIANPNCSTTQLVMALNPVFQQFGLEQVIISTYQAASGAGKAAMDEVLAESQARLLGEDMGELAHVLPVKGDKKHFPLAFNLLPQIDVFEEEGYTHEEYKMIHETKKIILGDKNAKQIKVTGTAVRVPVMIGHGESVYIDTGDEAVTTDQIRAAIASVDNVVIQDDPATQTYPQPLLAEGKRETFVGRIRPDLENPGAFHLWIVSDNLLKGAAWNTVEIAQELVKMDLVRVPADSAFTK